MADDPMAVGLSDFIPEGPLYTLTIRKLRSGSFAAIVPINQLLPIAISQELEDALARAAAAQRAYVEALRKNAGPAAMGHGFSEAKPKAPSRPARQPLPSVEDLWKTLND